MSRVLEQEEGGDGEMPVQYRNQDTQSHNPPCRSAPRPPTKHPPLLIAISAAFTRTSAYPPPLTPPLSINRAATAHLGPHPHSLTIITAEEEAVPISTSGIRGEWSDWDGELTCCVDS